MVFSNTYDKVLKELVNETTNQIPQFNNYTDESPLIILEKLMTSLYISNETYANRYIKSNYVNEDNLNVDYKLNKVFNLKYNEVFPIQIGMLLESTYLYDTLISIDVGSKFTFDAVEFTNFEAFYLNPQNNYLNLDLVEGKYTLNIFTGTTIDNGKLIFTDKLISTEHIRVTVDNVVWERTDNAQVKKGKYYSVVYEEGVHKIVFSNDYTTQMSNNSNINIEYIVSQGIATVDQYSNDFTINSPIYDNSGNNIKDTFKLLSLSHLTQLDNQKYDNYKLIPKLSIAKNKAISCFDYTYISEYNNNIALAAAYDINSPLREDEKLNIITPYITKIVVAPTQNRYVTDKAKEDLLNNLRANGLLETDLTIQLLDPDYILLDLNIRINSSTDDAQELFDIKTNILTNLKDNFKIGKIPFASTIYKDFIYSVVLNSDSRINYIDITRLNDIQLKATELPLLGNIDITFNLSYKFVEDTFSFNEYVKAFNQNVVNDQFFFNDRAKVEVGGSSGATDDSFNFDDSVSSLYTLTDETVVNEVRTITLCSYFENTKGYSSWFSISVD